MVIKRRTNLPDMLNQNNVEIHSNNSGGIYNDLVNIILLLFLYVLQGIPIGLASAVPFILQSNARIVNYNQQATFSWAFWPFSLKLAWAPLVDSIYFTRFGRRKTWLVPIQYLIGFGLILLSSRVDTWLGRPEGKNWGPLEVVNEVNIYALTVAFFCLTMLAATQDIAVDGWALTMLSQRNVTWASTCNSIGQSFGYILAFAVFLALESPDICNTYLRSVSVPEKGLISFSGFLYFWGVVFLITTSLVALFKREISTDNRPGKLSKPPSSLIDDGNPQICAKDDLRLDNNSCVAVANINAKSHLISAKSKSDTDVASEFSLWQTYVLMWKIVSLEPILYYFIFLFTVKFIFSSADSIFGLKLIELGASKERLALLATLSTPLHMVMPLFITHWSNGPTPLRVSLNAGIVRAFFAFMTVPTIYFTPLFRTTVKTSPTPVHVFPSYFYAFILVKFIIYSAFHIIMYVCCMAYNARISDPLIGGTYMTLLNTATNLAGNLPSTLMLYLVEPMTIRRCDGINHDLSLSMALNNSALPSSKYTSKQLDSLLAGWLSTHANCKPTQGIVVCKEVGGSCSTIIDGFYLQMGICLVVGLVSLVTFLRPLTRRLDSLPISAYRLARSPSHRRD